MLNHFRFIVSIALVLVSFILFQSALHAYDNYYYDTVNNKIVKIDEEFDSGVDKIHALLSAEYNQEISRKDAKDVYLLLIKPIEHTRGKEHLVKKIKSGNKSLIESLDDEISDSIYDNISMFYRFNNSLQIDIDIIKRVLISYYLGERNS